MNNQTQHGRTLQILLWLWFGTITSFVSVNVVNIASLQAENKILHKNMDLLKDQIVMLSFQNRHTIKPEKQ
jgi:hypothetical protein